MKTDLVYLVFGKNLKNHYQCAFSCLSFLAKASEDIGKVYIVTDNSQFYSFFGERICVVDVDEKTLLEWQGAYSFFWRVKIKALAHVAQLGGQNLLYLDSDTILYSALQLNEGAYMHQMEGQLKFLRSKNRTTLIS